MFRPTWAILREIVDKKKTFRIYKVVVGKHKYAKLEYQEL